MKKILKKDITALRQSVSKFHLYVSMTEFRIIVLKEKKKKYR